MGGLLLSRRLRTEVRPATVYLMLAVVITWAPVFGYDAYTGQEYAQIPSFLYWALRAVAFSLYMGVLGAGVFVGSTVERRRHQQ